MKELKRSMTDMQTELQDALQRATEAVAQEQRATQDSKLQVGVILLDQVTLIAFFTQLPTDFLGCLLTCVLFWVPG